MAAIEISGLSKDYPVGFWRKRPWRALDNLSLCVERGEVFGFLGHNGAGKTTTLKILTGLIFPTAGAATIQGRPIGHPEAVRNIGYLPENPYFYDYLTAEELLDYFSRFFPMSPQQRRERSEQHRKTARPHRARSASHAAVHERAPRRDDERHEIGERRLPPESPWPLGAEQDVALVDREQDRAHAHLTIGPSRVCN